MDAASTNNPTVPEFCEVCGILVVDPFECEDCGMTTCGACFCECDDESDDSWIEDDDDSDLND